MNQEFEIAKARREHLRWLIILTLNNARPLGAYEALILTVARSEFIDASQLELRRELSYLHERKLITIKKEPTGKWHNALTHHGVDLAEYNIDCTPGIARPEKYW